ncbi:hypothetical protein SAY87_015792 [Trapa incisa]|uniref:Uncharacterized protein n=1 Tax=Trapa incisa TaxID=236973 RepID=A0AAN7QWW6_9MYRT|nr:hypothetical protein SAY87_015792 [Trapa incisa]
MAADHLQVLKRQREEVEEEPGTLALDSEKQQMHQSITIKRQKSSPSSSSSSSSNYNETALSLLDEGAEKLTQQDLSSLISTLQQELLPSDDPPFDPLTCSATSEFDSDIASEEEVDGKERVLRHLLEASDDELGLPSREEGASSSSIMSESSLFSSNAIDGVALTNLTSFDGLWELEDEAANYYTLLQSELFMESDDHHLGINY